MLVYLWYYECVSNRVYNCLNDTVKRRPSAWQLQSPTLFIFSAPDKSGILQWLLCKQRIFKTKVQASPQPEIWSAVMHTNNKGYNTLGTL